MSNGVYSAFMRVEEDITDEEANEITLAANKFFEQYLSKEERALNRILVTNYRDFYKDNVCYFARNDVSIPVPDFALAARAFISGYLIAMRNAKEASKRRTYIYYFLFYNSATSQRAIGSSLVTAHDETSALTVFRAARACARSFKYYVEIYARDVETNEEYKLGYYWRGLSFRRALPRAPRHAN